MKIKIDIVKEALLDNSSNKMKKIILFFMTICILQSCNVKKFNTKYNKKKIYRYDHKDNKFIKPKTMKRHIYG